jgi:predicted short-subunit dehydrogenase-like oxidoreductase (DUF2520 family)
VNALEPIAIIGGGRAGCSIAVGLAMSGLSPWLVVRDSQRRVLVQTWLATLALPRPVQVLADLRRLARARTIVLAVPDRALAEVAADLAHLHAHHPQSWLHISGVAPAEVLRIPGSLAGLGSVHPLCALPDPVAATLDAEATAAPLHGALMALDGEEPTLQVARAIAESLGGLPLVVRPEARPAYHAAAALVANDLVGLLALGTQACETAGLPQAEVRQGLVHLARTSLQAVARVPAEASLVQGLTGAVSRGDAETVARHLQALPPQAREVHRLLSLRLVLLVEGTVSPERIASLCEVLRER